MKTFITRRRLLWAFIATVSIAGAARIIRHRLVETNTFNSFRKLLAYPKSAQKIGAIFIAKYPKEADSTLLKMKIAGSLTKARHVFGQLESEPLAVWIRSRILEDFRAGQIIEVDGWVLSYTEVRLCALLYLN